MSSGVKSVKTISPLVRQTRQGESGGGSSKLAVMPCSEAMTTHGFSSNCCNSIPKRGNLDAHLGVLVLLRFLRVGRNDLIAIRICRILLFRVSIESWICYGFGFAMPVGGS